VGTAALRLAALVVVCMPVAAGAQGVEPSACTEGVISRVELDRRSVFDPESTEVGALQWTYRALNLLHVRTAESFIRRELLFEEGDCFDPFLASESQRLLETYGFLAQVSVTDADDGEGGRRMRVSTQDEWSTQVALGVTYDGGFNVERFSVAETNFLGQGIFAQFSHRDRRETKSRSLGLTTPRFFGRSDAGIEWSQGRTGHVFDQYVRYPFVGETGRTALRQGYSHRTDFFTYSAEGTEAFTHTLVPAYRELAEFSAARRYGEPGALVVAGISLTRDVVQFPVAPQVAFDEDFDDLEPFSSALPQSLSDQLQPGASTRVAFHLGARRQRYVEYEGLDGVRDRMLVSLGMFAGLTLGRGFSVLTPEGVPGVDDYFGRVRGSFGVPVGSSILHGSFTVESRRDAGAWKDVLADADVVGYLRNGALRGHTLFVRASMAGGWNTTLPFQVRLGGREGVRSLVEDRFPGGRMARFVVEDRIAFPWPPSRQLDLGLTAFGDLGRVWTGDAPFTVDSGWQAALGIGLRIGFPAGTRNVWRTDVAFPVGPTGGSPIFRVTFEFNRMRNGFFTPDVSRSRRFNTGPDYF
jgi:hypothetical protein